jgi:diguanylate cyclase (GGDEF)-like protein
LNAAPQSTAVCRDIFNSYVALANALVGDLTGLCVVNAALQPWGQSGDLQGPDILAWLQSQNWQAFQDQSPATRAAPAGQWWTAMPIEHPGGALLGVFCASQRPATAPAPPAATAVQLAARLKPLLDCVQRDLLAAKPAPAREQALTERTAELEWLFQVTNRLRGTANEQRIVEELLKASTERLGSALGILSVPDKRLTVFCERDAAAASLREAWRQTEPHLRNWAQRQKRPLVVNKARAAHDNLMRCKVICVPIVRESGRVMGLMAFYNPATAPDFRERHAFLARHIGRQAAGIVEAQFDLMTGLYTRSGLDQVCSRPEDETDCAERSVLYLDIDHMHVANELHGFELGNELIVRVADLLTTPLLPADALAARISGDRFAVVLPQSNAAEAGSIAENLRVAASRLVIGPSKDVFDVSISCGISVLLPMPDGLSRAIAAAELACKTAKSRGRNRVEVYALEDGSMMRRHRDAMAVGQLRSALKADRLLLYAQRIHPLQNPGLAGGYELLLRLRDVDGTLVPPGPLIEAAQRYQILPTIDRWVVQRALQTLGPYRGMLRTRQLGMSINVSGQSIGDEAFIQHFAELLRDANLPGPCVSVELTEQAAVTNMARAGEMVVRLGGMGCRFALDDFGTGANSLTYLKGLKVYRVKIDGSFVLDVLSNRNSQATVRAIVELARGMGIETVAEYVETQAIAAEVRRLGVDYAQGYAFGKPQPLDDLLKELSVDESRRLHRLFLET